MEQHINSFFAEMCEITSQLNQRLATHGAKFNDMVCCRDYMFERLMGEIQALKARAAQSPSSPTPYRHTPPFQPRPQYQPSFTHHQQDISSHHRPYWYPPSPPYSNSSHHLQPCTVPPVHGRYITHNRILVTW
jgi:hypothetical protein